MRAGRQARERGRVVKNERKRFFMPEYIGARGWVGVRLDTKRVDWKDVTKRVVQSYRSVAPRRLAGLA